LKPTKKVALLSSLDHPDQRGGAYLRIKAIKEIYEKLGLHVELYYQSQVPLRKTLRSYFKAFYYHYKTMSLFREGEVTLPNADFLHLDNLRQFNWSISIEGNPRPALIYNAHNLESENYYDRKVNKYSIRMLDYEIEKIKQCQAVWVCSQRERDILLHRDPSISKKVMVVPNLVERELYRQLEKDTISFVGSLNYFPNVHAVNYLCDEFYPKLPEEIKNKFRFVIAGRSPSQEMIEKINQSGFELMSDLSEDQMYDLVGRTYISLVPLIYGSGTRLKILEAVFSHCLVLSTPLGREGIESPIISEAPLERFHQRFIEMVESGANIDLQDIENFACEFDTETWFLNHRQGLQHLLGIES
jgi:glycosyltransferase involved in cell wall biosynthesis